MPAKSYLSVSEAEALLRDCLDDDSRRYVALSLFAGLRPVELAALRWEDFTEQRDALLCSAKGVSRTVPLSANLRVLLKPPTAAHGLVATPAAARKVRALLAKLKAKGSNVLRTTCVLCWLALHGVAAATQHAGLSQVPEQQHSHLPISRADAERFFSIALG